MNALLIVENPEERMLLCYAQYRYFSVSIEDDPLGGMIGILRIWFPDDDCHTFVIDPDKCVPRCKTPDKFLELLKQMTTANRFTVHGEP